MSLFRIGEHYPHPAHKARINRYRENKKIMLGQHYDVFEEKAQRLTGRQANIVYITANVAGIICKKSADFLFGETPTFSAGTTDDSPEQQAIERLVRDNELSITNYESAIGNAYRGDSFYKIRWGQKYGGLVPESIDPYAVHIDAQNAEFVFPEASPTDANTVICYHVAYPQLVEDTDGDQWILHVESHYPGVIAYAKYRMNAINYIPGTNEVCEWRIYAEITDARRNVTTGVPFPLVIHIPNYSLDDDWMGLDDLSEHHAIFDEINNRLSKIAEILDKHADPAIVVPVGSMDVDENGQPFFRVGHDKVFEADKNDMIPQYVTWNGQLESAFKEVERLLDMLLMNAEIPAVALGRENGGTSGASGISIKWRMNSLLAKINRKRQYYDKGLKHLLFLAQLLEHAQSSKRLDYKPTIPHIHFRDGLPDDEMEMAQIAQMRTGGRATQSQLSAIMEIHGYTEEQAKHEIARIKEEEDADLSVQSSVFNEEAEPEVDEEEGGDEE